MSGDRGPGWPGPGCLLTGLGAVLVDGLVPRRPLPGPGSSELAEVLLSPFTNRYQTPTDGRDQRERDQGDDPGGAHLPRGDLATLGDALARLELRDALQGGVHGGVAATSEAFLQTTDRTPLPDRHDHEGHHRKKGEDRR